MFQTLIEQVSNGGELTEGQVHEAVEALVSEQISAEAKADFLTALAAKGETTGEIAAFAGRLREKAVAPPVSDAVRRDVIMDVCGTGGDHLNTFNVSTTVALVVAAAGVTVAKHGNRAITSKSGSADVLEQLGIRTDLPPEQAAKWLEKHQFAFFFAPMYHPAFKHIAPARKLCAERKTRTIFNFLGPLLNPARPSAQLIGAPRPELCEPLAKVLRSLGIRRGMVVSGRVEGSEGKEGWLDELSTLGPTTVASFESGEEVRCEILERKDSTVQLSELTGGDRETNARITLDLLEGKDTGPKFQLLLLNAGAALLVAGRSQSLNEGMDQAREVIVSGVALTKLKELSSASEQSRAAS